MVVARPTRQVTHPPAIRAAVAPGRLMLFAALALVTGAALVGTGVVAPKIAAAGARDDRRVEVLHAARQQAVNFTTLDYRHLDRDLGRVLAGSTGDFRKQFRAGTKNLTELVTANKAVSAGEVLEAGVVSSDADSARVLVVADSTVVNRANPKGEKRHYRIQLDLVRRQGSWLVSDLTFVG
jgi:Mce-associated membrane protein